MDNLLVMKFGGTSMGSADRMKVAAEIIAKEQSRRPVVTVVSAMAKITDLLLEALRHAEVGDRASVEAAIDMVTKRHEDAAKGLGTNERAQREIERLVNEFQRICNGVLMLGERPPKSVDEAIAIGERLSALLLTDYMNLSGIPAQALNGSDVIVTDTFFGNASPQMEPTRKKCESVLVPVINAGRTVIVSGFAGATPDGRTTTLGRGGSDFSASILAAALDAHELFIWTDVDGIMTADPRIVKDVAVLDELTYAEAAELAYNGAKILHPRTLAPLVEKRIPVWSKNSFAPHKPGTKIVSSFKEPKGARAVTSMSNVALISMEPATSQLTGVRLMARAMDALALTNVEILVFTSSSYRESFCFLVRKRDLSTAMEALQANLSIELAHGYLKPIDVDENVGLMAVVGEGMRGTPGLAGRVFTAISREETNIIAIAQGSSELTIGIVVRADKLDSAVRAVHDECQLGRANATIVPPEGSVFLPPPAAMTTN